MVIFLMKLIDSLNKTLIYNMAFFLDFNAALSARIVSVKAKGRAKNDRQTGFFLSVRGRKQAAAHLSAR